jgi:hypothetical protein
MFFTDYSMSPMELSDIGANRGCKGPTARRRRISRMSDEPQTDGFGPLLTLGCDDGDALPFR